jgi:hypothetical protein
MLAAPSNGDIPTPVHTKLLLKEIASRIRWRLSYQALQLKTYQRWLPSLAKEFMADVQAIREILTVLSVV